MSFIDELTRRISTEVQRTLDSAIRNAIEAYIVGEGTPGGATAPTGKRRSTKTKKGSRTAGAARAQRNKLIIDAVAKIGEATVEDVAGKTGLDKRGRGQFPLLPVTGGEPSPDKKRDVQGPDRG